MVSGCIDWFMLVAVFLSALVRDQWETLFLSVAYVVPVPDWP